MAEGVVHILEAIEIKVEDREVIAAALDAREGDLEALQQRAAVGETGEAIGLRELQNHVVRGFERRTSSPSSTEMNMVAPRNSVAKPAMTLASQTELT